MIEKYKFTTNHEPLWFWTFALPTLLYTAIKQLGLACSVGLNGGETLSYAFLHSFSIAAAEPFGETLGIAFYGIMLYVYRRAAFFITDWPRVCPHRCGVSICAVIAVFRWALLTLYCLATVVISGAEISFESLGGLSICLVANAFVYLFAIIYWIVKQTVFDTDYKTLSDLDDLSRLFDSTSYWPVIIIAMVSIFCANCPAFVPYLTSMLR